MGKFGLAFGVEFFSDGCDLRKLELGEALTMSIYERIENVLEGRLMIGAF